MSKLIRFKPRYRKRPAKAVPFSKLLAVALLGSFAVGAGMSGFINDDGVVDAQAITLNSVATAASGKSPQATKGTAVTDARPAVRYGQCVDSVRVNCVVDGDTLWSGGVKIRVADIDAPEVSEPRCAAEKALGDRATTRLIALVNAGPFQMQAWQGRDEDKYGRKLRVLVRDGRSLGDILVSEGLARTWTGKRQPWC
ncbi:thermonuclease family protein [Agrobacterium rosae]|uniref:thermonuclease family protein n=1 Tax=Agrobacterium rosae TaxID=1972867 RepID=UPI000CD8A54B|nr:thermonuclease family protein [Agrobacterium rosae]POO57849.1 nuclease [Agrobacterium rosae]